MALSSGAVGQANQGTEICRCAACRPWRPFQLFGAFPPKDTQKSDKAYATPRDFAQRSSCLDSNQPPAPPAGLGVRDLDRDEEAPELLTELQGSETKWRQATATPGAPGDARGRKCHVLLEVHCSTARERDVFPCWLEDCLFVFVFFGFQF